MNLSGLPGWHLSCGSLLGSAVLFSLIASSHAVASCRLPSGSDAVWLFMQVEKSNSDPERKTTGDKEQSPAADLEKEETSRDGDRPAENRSSPEKSGAGM